MAQEEVATPDSPEEQGRLFFAALVPRPLQAAVQVVQTALRRVGADIKWVEPHNLHFTLKFLGDTPLSAAPALSELGRQVAGELSRGRVLLRGVGAFPHSGWPQVVWVGCEEGREALEALAHRLDEQLAAAGLASLDKRPFEPHLTLGRARSNRRMKALAELLRQMERVEVGPMLVVGFALMRSELLPEGPQYTLVDKFLLGGAAPPGDESNG